MSANPSISGYGFSDYFGPPILSQEEPEAEATSTRKCPSLWKIASSAFFLFLLGGFFPAQNSKTPLKLDPGTLAIITNPHLDDPNSAVTQKVRAIADDLICPKPSVNCTKIDSNYLFIETDPNLNPPEAVVKFSNSFSFLSISLSRSFSRALDGGRSMIFTPEEASGVVAHECSHVMLEKRVAPKLPLRNQEFAADANAAQIPKYGRGLRNYLLRFISDPKILNSQNRLATGDDNQHPHPLERIDRLNEKLCKINPSLDPDYDFSLCNSLGFNRCEIIEENS